MYDLEERTMKFAISVRKFTETLPKSASNYEDGKQLIRSSGSIGANYIEANESLSRKDFLMRLKISRKEAKETIYWLRIMMNMNEDPAIVNVCGSLLKESTEIKNILSAIINKSTPRT